MEQDTWLFMERFIYRLRRRRKELGLSQFTVGELIGVANHLVAKWEVGIRRPSLPMALMWAEALGCKLELIPDEGYQVPQKYVSGRVSAPEGKDRAAVQQAHRRNIPIKGSKRVGSKRPKVACSASTKAAL